MLAKNPACWLCMTLAGFQPRCCPDLCACQPRRLSFAHVCAEGAAGWKEAQRLLALHGAFSVVTVFRLISKQALGFVSWRRGATSR